MTWLMLALLEHQSEFAVAGAAIIADGGDVFGSFASQGLNQVVGEAGTAKSAEHDARAIGNVRHGSVDAGKNFLLHENIGMLNFNRRRRSQFTGAGHGWVMSSARTSLSNSSPVMKPSLMAASRRLLCS